MLVGEVYPLRFGALSGPSMLSAVSPVRSSVIATSDAQVSLAHLRISLRDGGGRRGVAPVARAEAAAFGTPRAPVAARAAPPISKLRRVIVVIAAPTRWNGRPRRARPSWASGF